VSGKPTALLLWRTTILAAPEGAIKRLRGPGRKPARLTDDFYRLIGADYETHRQAGGHPGKELAAKYNTHPGNVSKWITEAKRRGYVAEQQG
jgi:hypothetical protein